MWQPDPPPVPVTIEQAAIKLATVEPGSDDDARHG